MRVRCCDSLPSTWQAQRASLRRVWFTGALADALWVAPIALQYVASYLARSVDVDKRAQQGFDIRAGHFVERHGGLLIVVLGK